MCTFPVSNVQCVVESLHTRCVCCTDPMHSMSKENVQSMFLLPMFCVLTVRFPCIQCPKKLCSPCFYVPCFVCLLYGSHAFNVQRNCAVHVSTSHVSCVCCTVPMHSISKESLQSMFLLPRFRVFAVRFPCIQCPRKMCSPCVYFPYFVCLLYGSHAFNVQRKCAVHVSTSHVYSVCCTDPMHSMSKENVQSMCLLPMFCVFAVRLPRVE